MEKAPASAKLTILVAPLDWGLGHATRCVPIIRALLASGCTVLIAGEGKTESLLRAEFPQLPFVHLKGYRMYYGESRFSLVVRLFQQIPKIISTINYEHRWLKEIVEKYDIHAVIADNRYGLYHKSIYSVFITHQLSIKTPFGKWVEAVLQLLNYRYINRFSACWVPDNEQHSGLAGALSHPAKKPAVPVYYVGLLSRFSKRPAPTPVHLLLMLSGPEPQRTLLEKQLLTQLSQYDGSVLLIRGLPGCTELLPVPSNTTVVNHLLAHALEEAMIQASYVIARCGYSTVMDLAVLQKKSILIPTPGQTEQEYLADYLMEKQIALCILQKKFKLLPALELATAFPYQFHAAAHTTDLQTVMQQLVQKLADQQSS